ncbi:type II secretion system protein [Humisphaera borealis]|uniref:Type II secretion system protein n=1 Tax=Humisphaera borealis TaxID=2807512 RepID=A0A7M2WSQ3_9BACT|nr:type II secretion system protein [Humisphaera borealis]QOV88538.1 type II secretion system protein [Humisphaera borealis]
MQRRNKGFTLVELLIVVGIVAALTGVVIPAVGKAKATAVKVACAGNLRQIGTALNAYRAANGGKLPVRPSGLDQTNPHVFKYKSLTASVAKTMEKYAESRDVFYCPGNYQRRTPSEWWTFQSGTIAATYQFPFWLKSSYWLVKVPDYRRPNGDAVIAADYLGTDTTPAAPLAWNHDRPDGQSPEGMNMLFGDNRVEWRNKARGWMLWGRSNGPIDWYLAN